MSKNIDSIIIATRNDELTREETKEEIKIFILELIGNDEPLPKGENVNGMKSIHRRKRNALRKEIRAKVDLAFIQDGDTCELCGASPMTANCNNANCDNKLVKG